MGYRPELAKLLRRLEAGDVLMVTRLDRWHGRREIAGALEYRPNGFALEAANADNHDRQRPHKQRAKNDGQYSQPHRDGRCRHPDVRWTELSRFGAHGLNLALIAIPPFPLKLLGT